MSRATDTNEKNPGTRIICDKQVDERCWDGNCRDCHVSLTFEDCKSGTWAEQFRANFRKHIQAPDHREAPDHGESIVHPGYCSGCRNPMGSNGGKCKPW